MQRSASMVILLLSLPCVNLEASAQTAYASTKELRHELEGRRADLARAEVQLTSLSAQLDQNQRSVAAAQANLTKVQESAAKRAAVLYRLTRRGVLVRYLLGSGSPVELLRRLGFLRALSITSLEARRQAGRITAQAEDQLTAAIQAHAAASQLIAELKNTISELEAELGQPGPSGKAFSPRGLASTDRLTTLETTGLAF